MNKKTNFLSSLFYGIKFLWQASPFYIICIIFYSGLSGAIVPVNTLMWKCFLDTISHIFTIQTWTNEVVVWLIGLSSLTVAEYILNAILQYSKQTFSDKLDLYVTNTILHKSISFSMSVYDDPETYNKLNMAITQTSQRCLSLLDTLSEIMYAIIQMVSMVILIAQYNWVIVLISFISAIPLAWISVKSNTYWYQVFVQRTERFRLINYLKMIMVKNENIKEIKLFQAGKKILDIISKSYEDFLKSDKTARKWFLVKHTGAQLLDEIASCCVKVGILCIALEQRATIGTCVMLFNTHSILKSSMLSLLNQFSNLHSSTLYLQAIQKIQKIQCEEKDESEKFNCDFSRIEFRDVSFKYPNSSEYALHHLSFVLEKGKTYSIVGFNGSGKTTLIKLLLKLYKPTCGAIYIDGVDLQNINTRSYHRQIGAVFQDFIKYPFSVAENIGIDIQSLSENVMDKIRKAGKLADADRFIQNLPDGYRTLLMKDWSNGVDISQGQWQKIAIARCFYRNSVISVLDEPFSSLDVDAENCIVQSLRYIRENRLNIFITHRFSSITLADKIIVIEHGKITEEGSHAELLQRGGTYAKLYKAQLISLEQI